jgi:hypothetical protein
MAAVAAIGSMLSATTASAGCFSCGCSAPVVYGYAYASPCAVYAAPPMYVINQGPAYTLPVPIAAEPTPLYGYPYVGATSSYYGAASAYDDDEVYPRLQRRHWHHRMGYDRFDGGYRHRGRPHIGQRFYRDERRFAHVPYSRMNMPYRALRQFGPVRHMAPRHVGPRFMGPRRMGPMPGVVHPQDRRY